MLSAVFLSLKSNLCSTYGTHVKHMTRTRAEHALYIHLELL